MKRIFILLTAVVICIVTGESHALATEGNIGFINFKKCVENSKQGQHERKAFDALKAQMNETLEKADKELSILAKNLEDQDYLDGLSPKAEEELRQKFHTLSQDFSRYQNQYYQLLNQANYKMLQTMHDKVSAAAEIVRNRQSLSFIINEDSAFAFSTNLDFTTEAIKEMDKVFDLESNTDMIARIER